MKKLKALIANNNISEMLIYIAVFIISSIAFFIILFPYSAVKHRILNEIGNRTDGKIIIENFEISPPLSFSALNLKYPFKIEEKQPFYLEFKKPYGKISFLHFLFGNISFSSVANLFDGKLKLTGDFDKKTQNLKFNFDAKNVSISFLKQFLKNAAFSGVIAFSGSGNIQDNLLQKGELEVNSKKLQINQLKIKGIPVADTEISTFLIDSTYAKRTINIKKGKIAGTDIDISFKGKINAETNFEDSLLNLIATVKITPAFLEKYDLKMFTGLILSKHKKEMVIPIKGTIKKPKFNLKLNKMFSPSKNFMHR